MSATTTQTPGQEKKNPSKDESYDEKVSVRKWNGKIFIKPVENVPMYRKTDKDGVVKMWTKSQLATDGNPDKGSELTDKDGAVWIVKKISKGAEFHVCTVEKKPAEKKP
ncbi:hypothetical protein VT84_05165 [Gemmata sp. SH-PL17]|uniref:hypothetical protein n=1 Tax=Gemmata sp. SH-PL17 TaxID=1630693 RepID=UPI00078B900E|nr:hypothetical protein [Gemmata sp. SH-PL17]AMV23780.1 hypothetical protein VT84_05165 [Gemmata sp. SH-PL17]